MAVSFESKTITRTTTQWVDYPKNIDIDPTLNGRHEPRTQEEIETLAADILANGQHTPVLLRKADNGKPVLVYGHGRWEAVSLLNKRGHDIQLLGNYESMSELEAFVAAIGENRFRKDVSPIDDAENIKIFIQRFKLPVEKIALIYFPQAKADEDVKRAITFVKQRQSLIELAPETAEAVRKGKIKVTAARKLAKMSKDAQRERLTDAKNGRVKVRDVTRTSTPSQKSIERAQAKVNDEVQKLVRSFLKDFTTDDIENDEFEFISVDRLKLRKLFVMVGLVK